MSRIATILGASSPVVEVPLMPELEFYPDNSGGWRWRIKAANGRVIAAASEAYTRREDARRECTAGR